MVIEKRPFGTPTSSPDMRAAWDVVSPKIKAAAIAASKRLDELSIPHALIGGIAVGAHGAARATKDVDFLLRQHDAFQGDMILSFREGIPIAIDGVSIDYLTPEGNEFPELTAAALDAAVSSEGIRVVPLAALVLLKLQAGRRQDHEDVARLLAKARVESEVRQFLRENAPRLEAELDFALSGR
jgi:hypothetical protein